MSDTPETDAAQHEGLLRTNPIPMQVVTANFARKLERERDEWRKKFELSVDAVEVAARLARAESERDEARHKLDLCMAANSDVARIAKERNEALDQVKELIYIAERAIALAEIDFENDKFGVVSELRDGLERIKECAK
jgi:hypothetical protein